jgi:hypothetical protein
MTKFETLLISTIRQYREQAANSGKVARLDLTISATGRVAGDLKIAYSFSDDYGSGVNGNTLDDVFREFMRRKGWSETHAPLCLPNVEEGDIQHDSD